MIVKEHNETNFHIIRGPRFGIHAIRGACIPDASIIADPFKGDKYGKGGYHYEPFYFSDKEEEYDS